MLAGSIALNGFRHITVHDCCLGREPGEVDLPNVNYDWPGNFGSIEFGHEQLEYMGQTVLPSAHRVPVMRLDDFMMTDIRFLKIDVEGMEMDVLAGAEETILQTRVPLLLVEYLKGKREALRGWLEGWGYEVTTLPGAGSFLGELRS
jgi:FkbM family methyltransferase